MAEPSVIDFTVNAAKQAAAIASWREVLGVSYAKHGFDPVQVERIKQKMKHPETKERVKMILQGVTKGDLQDRIKVRRFVGLLTKALGERVTDAQTEHLVSFVISQKIDPNNTFHLIKLWTMFR